MSDSPETATIVIDNGCCNCRVGFSGDDMPRSTFPTIVGHPYYPLALPGIKSKDNFIGSEAQKKRSILSIKNPIRNGMVINWDAMEYIWQYAFYDELRVNPKNHAVLLTEAPLNPKSNREKMAQYMFEKFNVPAVNVAIPAVMSLYSTGMVTGVVYDSGEGVSHCLPIVNGYAVKGALKRMDFGGRNVTDYLARVLTEKGYSFLTPSRKEIARQIKDTLCMVSFDYEKNIVTSTVTQAFEATYELPDGQIMTIGNERFRAPEILFQPELLGYEFPGVHTAIREAVLECNDYVRRILFSNIVLSGGNTMFAGFVERLGKEITVSDSPSKVGIIAPPERKTSVWVGGSIVSSLACFSKMCLTKEDYDEAGPSAIHRICL